MFMWQKQGLGTLKLEVFLQKYEDRHVMKTATLLYSLLVLSIGKISKGVYFQYSCCPTSLQSAALRRNKLFGYFCVFVYLYVYMYVCICVLMYMYMYMCMYVGIYVLYMFISSMYVKHVSSMFVN